ncbi:MAG: dihydroorotate dehydrogenase-like protein [Leptospiraceae bacterium]|nr:dihydroorotate dehydrogenase-like protein [Leptospiraceae bacterium]MDW8306771.1 dihydroorotate dehydrogenase-like protein [Leptospiraceae bacterium]
MPDLSTTWLGFPLKNPLVIGASPVGKSIRSCLEAEEKGAAAIVLHSLFEEQLVHEQMGAHYYIDTLTDMDAETRSVFPQSAIFPLDGAAYLRHIEKLKQKLTIPLIASLNGTTPGGWLSYAKSMASAGCDALELNLYEVATDEQKSSQYLEDQQLEIVSSVISAVSIPVNVKLSPFYTSLPYFVRRLYECGVQGVSVFNRYYQSDINPLTLEVDRHLHLSSSAELPLRLHALAILSSKMGLFYACTGGIHSGYDMAKAILAGAHVTQVVSAVLAKGFSVIEKFLQELKEYMLQMGYESIHEMRGVMNLSSVADPHSYERLNYAQMLAAWKLPLSP